MKIQIATIVLVTCYIGCVLAERTVTIDGPEGEKINVTFVGRYHYINDDNSGEDLEVPVKLEVFKKGETTPSSVTYEMIKLLMPGTDITDDARDKVFQKLEEEKLEELKKRFASKS